MKLFTLLILLLTLVGCNSTGSDSGMVTITVRSSIESNYTVTIRADNEIIGTVSRHETVDFEVKNRAMLEATWSQPTATGSSSIRHNRAIEGLYWEVL